MRLSTSSWTATSRTALNESFPHRPGSITRTTGYFAAYIRQARRECDGARFEIPPVRGSPTPCFRAAGPRDGAAITKRCVSFQPAKTEPRWFSRFRWKSPSRWSGEITGLQYRCAHRQQLRKFAARTDNASWSVRHDSLQWAPFFHVRRAHPTP